jgi:hypothetical protein
VAEVRGLLANPARQRRIARRNFEIAQRQLSYKLLRRRLNKLLRDVTPAVTMDAAT